MKPFYLLVPVFFITHLLCAQTPAERLEEFMDAAYKAKLFTGVVLAARANSQLEFERDSNGKIIDVLLYSINRKVPHLKIK